VLLEVGGRKAVILLVAGGKEDCEEKEAEAPP